MLGGPKAGTINHIFPLDSAEKLLSFRCLSFISKKSKLIGLGQGPGVDILITQIIRSVSRWSPARGFNCWSLKQVLSYANCDIGSYFISLCLSFFTQKIRVLIVPNTGRFFKNCMIKCRSD